MGSSWDVVSAIRAQQEMLYEKQVAQVERGYVHGARGNCINADTVGGLLLSESAGECYYGALGGGVVDSCVIYR